MTLVSIDLEGRFDENRRRRTFHETTVRVRSLEVGQDFLGKNGMVLPAMVRPASGGKR